MLESTDIGGGMSGMIQVPRLAVFVFALACFVSSATAAGAESEGGFQWHAQGGNGLFQRYAPYDQIGKSNIDRLHIAWHRTSIPDAVKEKFPDISAGRYLRNTPVYANGLLYVTDGLGLVEALDPETGAVKWVQAPLPASMSEAAGSSTSAVAFWQSGGEKRVFSIRKGFLHSLDADTGMPKPGFGANGAVSLSRGEGTKYVNNNAPVVAGNTIVVGGLGGVNDTSGYGDSGTDRYDGIPDDVRGYDAVTGKLLWTFHVIKDDPDSWRNGSIGTASACGAWVPISYDPDLDNVYIPLSAPGGSNYGGQRPGDNKYCSSLVAVNARTGDLVWDYQLVHHDIWDYDVASPPVLGDVVIDGVKRKIVMQAHKNGNLFVLDRVTGEPVWPIVETPVPSHGSPGEQPYPTQPMPTKPEAFTLQGVTEDDLNDLTPQIKAMVAKSLEHVRLGHLFSPHPLNGENGIKGVLTAPWSWGGGNWNTGAFDPEEGVYYAVSARWPQIRALAKCDTPGATMAYCRTNAIDIPPVEVDGIPIIKPPYGVLAAYDMSTGDKKWQVAQGDDSKYRKNPLLKDVAASLPPMGYPGRPAALVTRSYVFLADSSDAVSGSAGIAGPAKLRAYRKEDGSIAREIDIPAGSTSGVMSYMHKGHQYICFAVSDRSFGSGWIALSMP